MDVLFGRGRSYQMHPGNERLRQVVEKYKSSYQEASIRSVKAMIVRTTIAELQQIPSDIASLLTLTGAAASGAAATGGGPNLASTGNLNRVFQVTQEPTSNVPNVGVGGQPQHQQMQQRRGRSDSIATVRETLSFPKPRFLRLASSSSRTASGGGSANTGSTGENNPSTPVWYIADDAEVFK